MSELIQHQDQPVSVQTESTTILQVIQRAAADPQCDIEKMERLMAMHERMQAKNAQTEFNSALASMQCDIPSIAERGAGHNKITYATLEDINDVIKPIMQRYGFAMSFKVEHAQGGISVTGILMHRAGHREETTMLLPSDTSGSKNAVQAVASSVSYGKRYVMCAMLNISTRGEDDDGYAAAPAKTITAAQANQLKALLAKCSEKAQAAFSNMYGTPAEVEKSQFDLVLGQLSGSAKKHAEQQAGAGDAGNN
jgi:hypothetical protein